jgi:hypothetical protein
MDEFLSHEAPQEELDKLAQAGVSREDVDSRVFAQEQGGGGGGGYMAEAVQTGPRPLPGRTGQVQQRRQAVPGPVTWVPEEQAAQYEEEYEEQERPRLAGRVRATGPVAIGPHGEEVHVPVMRGLPMRTYSEQPRVAVQLFEDEELQFDYEHGKRVSIPITGRFYNMIGKMGGEIRKQQLGPEGYSRMGKMGGDKVARMYRAAQQAERQRIEAARSGRRTR